MRLLSPSLGWRRCAASAWPDDGVATNGAVECGKLAIYLLDFESSKHDKVARIAHRPIGDEGLQNWPADRAAVSQGDTRRLQLCSLIAAPAPTSYLDGKGRPQPCPEWRGPPPRR